MNRPDVEQRIERLHGLADAEFVTITNQAALELAAFVGELALAFDELVAHAERAAPWIEEALLAVSPPDLTPLTGWADNEATDERKAP